MNTAGSARRRALGRRQRELRHPDQHRVDVAKQIEKGVPSATITIGTPGFLGIAVGSQRAVPGVTIGDVAGHPAESSASSRVTSSPRSTARPSTAWTP